MAQLIWTDPALHDVEEIAEYIALDNFEAARKLVQKVFSSIERLQQDPDSGGRPPELKKTLYREIIIEPCRVFYRVDNDKVYILYAMRGECKLRRYLLDERNREKKS